METDADSKIRQSLGNHAEEGREPVGVRGVMDSTRKLTESTAWAHRVLQELN